MGLDTFARARHDRVYRIIVYNWPSGFRPNKRVIFMQDTFARVLGQARATIGYFVYKRASKFILYAKQAY